MANYQRHQDLADKALSLAAEDMRWMLERGYPRERCLEMVGNRRGLDRAGREILRRVVMAPARAKDRRAKLLTLERVGGQPVGLDGHNVLLTLESALSGRLMVRGDDGALRDIARAAVSWRWSGLTERIAGLILDALSQAGVGEIRFYLDRPVSHSGRLADLVRREMAGRGMPGLAEAVPVPEKPLMAFQGLVATADGQLIDDCPRPIDLAGQLVDRDYQGLFSGVEIIEP